MDLILAGLKQLNVVTGSVLVVYAWSVLPRFRLRVLFLGMMLGFTISTVLYFPQGEINEWVKHAPFYVGQVIFFLFVYSFKASSFSTKKAAQRQDRSLKLPALMLFGGVELEAVAKPDSGLPHILVLPVFLATGLLIFFKMLTTRLGRFRTIMSYFLFASAALTMIHVVEFIFESHSYFGYLQGASIELLELVWFYVACAFFALALKNTARLK